MPDKLLNLHELIFFLVNKKKVVLKNKIEIFLTIIKNYVLKIKLKAQF